MSILIAANFMPGEWAEWLPALSRAMPQEALLRERRSVAPEAIDIAIVANPAAGALAGLPRLRFIQSLWAGVETLLADPTVPADAPLARMVDPAMIEAMAESALWAVLSLHRRCFDYARQQREARWAPHRQRTAGEVGVVVLGLGQMGRAVALRLARNGYRVCGWCAHPASLPGVQTLAGDAALPAALADAQVTVLPHVAAQTDATSASALVAANVAALRGGRPLQNLVDRAHAY